MLLGAYMARKKPAFDWSILDREGIASCLWLIADQVVNKKLLASKFHSILKKHIKTFLPIRISKKTDQTINSKYVYIGGTYYGEFDRLHKKCIEILFVYNSLTKSITMTEKRYKNLCFFFADTLLHEIIHMRQFRRRKFKVLPDYASNAEKTEKRKEQSYLGCSDEIDAYGFNIACDLMSRFKDKEKDVIKFLNVNLKSSKYRIDSWKMYLKAFDHQHNHPIIKRLKKKVVRYLPAAQKGKPYRNKDWIYY